jgi:hypothetical protein
MDTEQGKWWYCLKHHRAEDDSTDCAGKDLLGPYPTREAAARALETVKRRNEEWDAQDLPNAQAH